MGAILEFLITFVVLAVVGFYVGVGVLIYQESPKIANFLKTRPVIGGVVTFVTIGAAVYITLGFLMVVALFLINILLGGQGSAPVQ